MSAMLNELRTKLAAQTATVKHLADQEQKFKRNLSPAESRTFDEAAANARDLKERISELEDQEARDTASANAVLSMGIIPQGGGYTNSRGTVYTRGEQSWVKDMVSFKCHGSGEAGQRIATASKEMRAGVGTVNGAGGEFVPPLWLVDKFVPFTRPGRPTADLIGPQELPMGTDSINIPKVTGGTQIYVPAQSGAAQNTALQEQDIVTSSVSAPVITVGGGQTLSLQLIEQSPISFDRVIGQDLEADYDRALDLQVLSGTGSTGTLTGLLTLGGTQSVTVAAPTGSGSAASVVYSAVANATQKITSSRFAPPTAIVMHPRRWAALSASTDSTGRPLVIQNDGSSPFNALGVANGVVAQSYVGKLQGLPVFLDASIQTNLGTGTNEDRIIVAKWDDLQLFEGTPRLEAFPQTFASNLSLYIRYYNYLAFLSRYPGSVAILSGVGLATPTF